MSCNRCTCPDCRQSIFRTGVNIPFPRAVMDEDIEKIVVPKIKEIDTKLDYLIKLIENIV